MTSNNNYYQDNIIKTTVSLIGLGLGSVILGEMGVVLSVGSIGISYLFHILELI